MMPTISIIVPCYNQAIYLDECLQSVLDQTYGNWECIIVDDGSPDNTKEVTEKWIEKDNRFIYLHKENGGLSSARNAGIEAAKGA
ncbi:MAG TPA: glycosyltransferase family 2 protein, partial [Chryseobacterium indologenes]|nr:glycosyltransferase family 2 protein [Chryseobacterium indologenes]